MAWARQAGGVVIGKTVTTEFATRKPGPTGNPHNPQHTPGGSSSGSAAGVADCFFPLAYGTQTAGSVIRPAAYCGVVGYKPSYGMINRFGMKLCRRALILWELWRAVLPIARCLPVPWRGATSAIRMRGRSVRLASASAVRRHGIRRCRRRRRCCRAWPSALGARRATVVDRELSRERGGDRGGASDRHEQRKRAGDGLGTGERARADQRGAARAAGVRAVAERGGGGCRHMRCSNARSASFRSAWTGWMRW